MKKIDKNIYETCDYISNHTPGLSITKASELFGACRKTVAKHLKDYVNYTYFYNNSYYFISEEEKAPVLYFLENPEVSLEAAAREFGVKSNTIKRRMEVMGKEYSARVSRKYNRSIFKKLENIEQAYWLGFILADGYLNEDRGFLRIKLAIADENHLKKFGKFMQEENLENAIKYDCGGAYTKDNQCAYIEFSSRELTQDLTKFGIFQNKSGQEKPIDMPNEQRLKTIETDLIYATKWDEKNYLALYALGLVYLNTSSEKYDVNKAINLFERVTALKGKTVELDSYLEECEKTRIIALAEKKLSSLK